MKKDFSKINTRPVYEAMEEVTADPAEQEAAPAAQEQRKKYKERKTYTEQEAQEFLQSMQTAGRKGLELPRINVAFTPANYHYIKTMSRVRGETLTAFVNHILAQSMEENAETYKRAQEFIDAL